MIGETSRSFRQVSKKLRLLVSVTLLAGLAWNTDWRQVGQAFTHLQPGLWLAAFALYLVAQVVSSLRWQWLARPLGFQQDLRQFTGLYFIGMYFNLLLPTSVGGDVVRAYYLDNRSGRRLASLLSVFMDRFTGLLVLLALACAAVLVCPIELPSRVTQSVWTTAAGAVLAVAVLPVLFRWTGRFERMRRLSEGARGYLQQPGLLVGAAGLSLFVQAANVIVVWLIGKALAVPAAGAYFWILVPMVTLLTLLPLSVNGMGVREWATALFLAPLGVPRGLALSLALLWFAVFMAAGAVGGIVYVFSNFPKLEGPPDHESVRGDSDQGRTGQYPAAA
jgi:uncharacterized membrane protein YbhN (UPF0104 family)